MRIVLTTSALEGHFFPMVPLAWALRAAGHEVLVNAPANFTPTITSTGLYAAGEVAGFGGGGVHGYRSLEGTFLGGCLFSGREAARAIVAATAS